MRKRIVSIDVSHRRRIAVRHDEKHSAELGVGNPHFRSVENVIIAFLLGDGSQRESVAARRRFGQTETSDLREKEKQVEFLSEASRFGGKCFSKKTKSNRRSNEVFGHLRQIVFFLPFGSVRNEQTIHQCVLEIDQKTDTRIDLGQSFDDQHRSEERLSTTAVLRWQIDRHELKWKVIRFSLSLPCLSLIEASISLFELH